ncbi:MAG: FHIPEP family type III secretion protein, partial [Thermaurantiacus sp.]
MTSAELDQAPASRLGARLADVGLVAGIVAIVGLMVVPIPTWLIDVLVGVNICFGILLLLTTLYIREPLDFSSFPSVLLVSTLFRLALSIATTRLILLEGNAGHIIQTFGRMVAGGELVVGIVVFLIITVVQFIVIAKGAERVAEVSARFSLDGMPGKQLSIDSDLRSGLIDKDEARARRRKLEQESKLHGSLDGAMKFVKGDAIASIIIVIVNLLGGLAIGVMQRGMEFGAAVEKYSILTIGDGLVSQIPALLSAMAAGLLVTRASDEGAVNLGDAIRRQVSRNPRVLLFGGAIAMLMAAVPGFPLFVFLSIGAAGLLAGLLLHPRTAPILRARFAPLAALMPAAHASEQLPDRLEAVAGDLKPLRPLVLELDLAPDAGLQAHGIGELRASIEGALGALQARSGVPVPRMAITLVHGAPAARWRLLVFEAEVASGPLDDSADALATRIAVALGRQLAMLLGVQETTTLLNRVGIDYAEAVKEAVRAVPVTRIAEVLRMLADEQVPLTNMRDILESIAEAGQHQRDAGPIADMVRIAVRRHTLASLAAGGQLRAAVVAPALEDRLRASTRPGETRPALAPNDVRELVDTVRTAAADGARALIVSLDLRRAVRGLVGPDLPDVAILSYQELDPR